MTTITKFTRFAGRVVAAICLYVGLTLASRILGMGDGSLSPLVTYGVTAFTWLTIFTLGYLFAAVGIWIGSAWGLVMAIGIAFSAIVLVLVGDPGVRLSAFDFFIALLVLVSASGLFAFLHIKSLSSVHD